MSQQLHSRPGSTTSVQAHTNGNAAFQRHASAPAASYQSDKVRVAIIGVGNCASAFVQGVNYYRDANPGRGRPRA